MDNFEVIAAFLDGERVDPAALKHALASAEGRDYFVDILALREMTTDRAPDAPVVLSRVAPRRAPWVRRVGAAAAVVVCVVGAFVAGHRSADVPASPVAPAVGSDRPGGGTGRPVSAPPPTSVIRFQPGVDWTETSGGN
jgi:hypothetical protein